MVIQHHGLVTQGKQVGRLFGVVTFNYPFYSQFTELGFRGGSCLSFSLSLPLSVFHTLSAPSVLHCPNLQPASTCICSC